MRLVVVSNRLPFSVSMKGGRPAFEPSPGGMASGLWSCLERRSHGSQAKRDFLWLGWPGATVPQEHHDAVREYAATHFNSKPVFCGEESMNRFYHGFCNRTIWPLFHYFPSLARFEEEYWQEYTRMNAIFRDAVLEALQPDDVVWVHDYQLMLLPKLLRERNPDLAIGFFLHIPFPSFEVFRLLPRAWRCEIIEGMLGADLIGSHTHDYTRYFLGSVLRTVGYEHQLGSLFLRDRVIKVDTFPMGIDFDRFATAAESDESRTRLATFREQWGDRKVIFSADRLDYTKGIINRLRGYELFLRQNPQWHGKVVFVLSVVPSRIGVESYQAMKQEIEQTVGRIGGSYSDVSWTPILFQYRNLSNSELIAMYRFCDVALITPLRDGMNLVAKEFIASRADGTGVLVLSEMAGAAKELGEAIITSPFHAAEIAHAIEQALTLPPEEQIRRNQIMQERLRRYDVVRWADDFIESLLATKRTEAVERSRFLTGKALRSLVQDYRVARRRALLLDYDGTLVPFTGDPKLARPDNELLALLGSLAADSANALVIVSGRTRNDLDEWFAHLSIALIAEHGVWLRTPGVEWHTLRPIVTGWKNHIRPILQQYVDRLPGALLEEKEFSLAWHFRRADPDQGSQRAKELLDDLADYTRNIDIQVLEGNKVIEVRNIGVNKGTAAVEWLTAIGADYVLAIGDDWTDEDLFRALPPEAYTIRVGHTQTAARFHLGNHNAVRRLLRDLIESDTTTQN